MNQGLEIPKWAFFAVAGVVAVLALVFISRALSSDGPRDPSTYPKEAYQPPAYSGAEGGGYGGYTKDGKPVR